MIDGKILVQETIMASILIPDVQENTLNHLRERCRCAFRRCPK